MTVKTEFIVSAEDQSKGAFDSVRKNAGEMAAEVREGLNTVALSFGAAASAAAVAGAAMIKSGIDSAREIDNLSRVAGAGVEEFQRMAFGAKSLGIEQDKLADIIKDTNDKLGDFLTTGGGAAADFFENIAPKVGVTAEQFRNLSGPDALQLYYDSLQKANLSQQELTFYMEAIASDATALIPLLKDGGEAMGEQAKQADALGIVLTKIDVEKLKQAGGAMDQVQAAFGGFGNQLAVQFSPVVTALSNEVLDLVRDMGGFGEISAKAFNVVIEGAGYAANVVHGLGVVWDGVKVVVAGGIEWALRYFEVVETGIRWLLDKIPGVEVSTDSAIGNLRQSLTNVREDFTNELKGSLLEPLPYEGVIKWAEDATRIATEAARNAAETSAMGTLVGGSAPAGGNAQAEGEEDPELTAMQQRIEQLKILKDAQLASEMESEQLAYLQRLEMLRLNFEEGTIPTLEAYHSLVEGVANKHEQNLTKISAKGLSDREKFLAKSGKDQTKQVFGDLANITAGVANHNKGLFELNKAAGIANAIINTYEGVSKSLSAYPMPLAAVMAAAHLASGMAQVAAIKSTQFGSGSAGATSVGGAPVTTAPSNIAQNAQATTTQEAVQEKPQTVYINIEPDANYNGRQLRQLMEQLSEQAGFNVKFGT